MNKNEKGSVYIAILFILLAGILVLGFVLMTTNQKETTPEVQTQTSNVESTAETLSFTDIKMSDPQIIQQRYPEQRVKVGGQLYNATNILITGQLFVPEENDYLVRASFDDLGSIVTIDGITAEAFESEFHLTSGIHLVEISYVNERCLSTEYIEDEYGTQPEPRSIYLLVRKKSERQLYDNITTFENGTPFEEKSTPIKKKDLYSHCF